MFEKSYLCFDYSLQELKIVRNIYNTYLVLRLEVLKIMIYLYQAMLYYRYYIQYIFHSFLGNLHLTLKKNVSEHQVVFFNAAMP